MFHLGLSLSQCLAAICRCFQFPLHLHVPTLNQNTSGLRRKGNSPEAPRLLPFSGLTFTLTFPHPCSYWKHRAGQMPCSFSLPHRLIRPPTAAPLLCLHSSLLVVYTHFTQGCKFFTSLGSVLQVTPQPSVGMFLPDRVVLRRV